MMMYDFYKNFKIVMFYKNKYIYLHNPFMNKIEILNLKEAQELSKIYAKNFDWGIISDNTKLLAFALIEYFFNTDIAKKLYANFAEKLASLEPKDTILYANEIVEYVLNQL